MSKLLSMAEAIAQFVPDGASVAMSLQLEQMIPFAAAHEIIRQKKRNLTLIGPISDVLFDQLIGAGCADHVIAAWVGNAMMGSAYNFRRGVEAGNVKVFNMTNFTLALALQAAGKRDALARVTGSLVADPSALIQLGWAPALTTRACAHEPHPTAGRDNRSRV